MKSLPYRLRYYAKKLAGFLGFCYRCRTTLNYTRSRVGICPKCGLRH